MEYKDVKVFQSWRQRKPVHHKPRQVRSTFTGHIICGLSNEYSIHVLETNEAIIMTKTGIVSLCN